MKVGTFPSPLRYPGGKGKISNFMRTVFIENGLTGSEYIEPYAGGASVALSLLFEEYASHVQINDLNSSVYAFWEAVVRSPDDLCSRIAEARLDIEEWDRQRNVQDATDADPIELAFSTFYLNRTSRSGILLGGVIGGKNQTGPWSLDARFNKPDLIGRIMKISRFASRITVSRLDAAELLAGLVREPKPLCFLYIDPPYYAKGQDLYQNFYGHDDHEGIAKLVSRLTTPWIVSYDAAPQVAAMYKDFSVIEYRLSYSASRRYSGNELMFFSDMLSTPHNTNPTSVSTADVNRLKMAGIKDARGSVSSG